MICPCGERLQGDTDQLFVDAVKAHFEQVHPQMVGKYTDDQMLSVATEV
jgi:hypothetical protein